MRIGEILRGNRTVAVLFAVVLIIGAALRFAHASDPKDTSVDERSYIKLASEFKESSTYGTTVKNPRHWSPGAPLAFGLVAKIFPFEGSSKANGLPAAYYFQATVSTLTIVLLFGLTALLAGPWAGLIASSIFAFHTSMINNMNHLLSEPLGAFALIATIFSLLLVWQRSLRWLVIPGVLLAVAILTRADLLPVLPALAALVLLLKWKDGFKTAVLSAVVLTVGSLLLLAPWSAEQSKNEGAFVPVTSGGGASLFVGTFLPGNGSAWRTKRYFGWGLPKEIRDNPKRPATIITGTELTNIVSRKHPGLTKDQALRLEAKVNIKRYAFGQPWEFTKMMLDKAGRTWLKPSTPGSTEPSNGFRLFHLLVSVLGFLGFVLGFLFTRERRLLIVILPVAVGTLLHMIVVTNPRYAIPLYPLMLAAGVAGWFKFAEHLRKGKTQPDQVVSNNLTAA